MLALLQPVKVVLLGVERNVVVLAELLGFRHFKLLFHLVDVDKGRRKWEFQVFFHFLSAVA